MRGLCFNRAFKFLQEFHDWCDDPKRTPQKSDLRLGLKLVHGTVYPPNKSVPHAWVESESEGYTYECQPDPMPEPFDTSEYYKHYSAVSEARYTLEEAEDQRRKYPEKGFGPWHYPASPETQDERE